MKKWYVVIMKSLDSERREKSSFQEITITNFSRQNIDPAKDVHTPVPRTCEYITLDGGGGGCRWIRLRTLRWRDYSGFSG